MYTYIAINTYLCAIKDYDILLHPCDTSNIVALHVTKFMNKYIDLRVK